MSPIESASQLPISDEMLQQYFDDALSTDERAKVTLQLDANAHLRLDALFQLRTLVRAHTAAASATVNFSSTIDAIERAETPRNTTNRRALIPLSAVGGFLAAAAAVFVLWNPGSAPSHHISTNEAEVEMLEVQGAMATVFRIEDRSNPGQSATVIWADDEENAVPGEK